MLCHFMRAHCKFGSKAKIASGRVAQVGHSGLPSMPVWGRLAYSLLNDVCLIAYRLLIGQPLLDTLMSREAGISIQGTPSLKHE